MDILSKSNNTTSLHYTTYMDFQTPGLIFCLIVALPGNVYVIWLIVTGAGNGVASEFFSLNLSVCEIFFCLQSFFCLMSRNYQDLWLIVGFLTGFSATGHPLFQCLICVERYLAVLHPVTFLKYKPLRYKVICCTVIWIIIILSCVFYCLTIIQLQMYLFMCWYLCQALLTFSIMFFCCMAVLRALKQSGPGERKREEENHMKRRAFSIIVKIIMAMLLVFASYFLTALSYILTHERAVEILPIALVCFVLGGLVQPLLYLHRTGKLFFCNAP